MAANTKYKRLFEPVQIGQMRIRNRIAMPGMASGYATEEGYVTPEMQDYYEARARGGVGLLIVETNCVDPPRGKSYARQLHIDDDRYIPGLTGLAQAIKKHGAKAALQLHHAGHIAKEANNHVQPVAPSAIGRPGGDVPHALTESEIADIVKRFAGGARRAKEAGFDGVEVHAAHRYLIAEFLSPAWNRREDRYGGPFANRARFLLEILQAIRDSVGKSFPVWCRINVEEQDVPNGFTMREGRELAKLIEKAGVDAINASLSSSKLSSPRPYFYPPGWAAYLAKAVKEIVSIPVIAVGRINPDIGEQLIQEKKADIVAIGRALRADPDFPNKVAAGKLDDIRPCITCGVCSVSYRPGGQRLCSVNAEIGREREFAIVPAARRKKVLVVGGGPAGMEAARVAALRGHKVTLCEKGGRVGGQLLLATVPPYKGEIQKFTDYLATQLEKLKVKTDLNTEVTAALVRREKPDAVILATGATPFVPPVASCAAGKQNVVTVEDVLAGRVEIGAKVVVLGGGMVGCEVAEFLAEKGKKVTVVEMLDRLATDMKEQQGRGVLLDILAKEGVIMLTQTKGSEISERGLVVTGKDGQRQTVQADTIVLACGSIPNSRLHGELGKSVAEIHVAGDCVKPRTLLEAVDDSARVGRAV